MSVRHIGSPPFFTRVIMDITTVKKRLTKLLALSASPNKAEADSAMTKCKILMEKYGIRHIDVDEVTKEVDIVTEIVPGYTDEHRDWESKLAASIADPFDAMALIKRNLNGDGSGWGIIFVATKTDFEFINHLYRHVRRTVSKQAKEYLQEHNNGKFDEDLHYSYCVGACETIHKRLISLYKGMSDSKALVPIKRKSIEETIRAMFGDILREDERWANNFGAMTKGMSAGKNVNLSRPISGRATRRVQ